MNQLVAMPDKEYFAMEALSNSGMKKILQSPLHFKRGDSDFSESKAMRLGTAVHQLLLEPDHVNVKVWTEGAGLTSKEAKAFIEDHPAHRVVTQKEYETAEKIRETLMDNEIINGIISHPGAKKEIVGLVETDGVKKKAKADLLNESLGLLLDLKTTGDLHNFERSIFKYRYDLQEAFYSDLFGHFMPIKTFVFLAVETAPPYDHRFFTLNPEVRENANKDIARATAIYKTCTATNFWPGYSDEIVEVGLPTWMVK